MTDTAQHTASQSETSAPSPTDNQPLPLPLTAMVESLLFVASEPVPVYQIAEALNVPIERIERSLAELRDGLDGVVRGVRLQRKGDRVQLTTQPEAAPYIEKFLDLDLTSRLSKPALETLAIIAYQQPVTRAQIEHVRGVNCDAVLSTLLNRGLIEEVGRLETAGRPIQYGTTFAFLQHFGLRGLDDMPSLQPEEAATLEAIAGQGHSHDHLATSSAAPQSMSTGDQLTASAPPEPPVVNEVAAGDRQSAADHDGPAESFETQLPFVAE